MAETLRTRIKDTRAESRTYRRLRRHLNSLPIAFPRTILGAELRILRRTTGEDTFALLPFIVGMFEFQAERLTPEFIKDSTDYMKRGFAFEYLTTVKPQTRIIPVQRALPQTNKVAAYDEFEQLIRAAEGHIAVARCICRVTADIERASATVYLRLLRRLLRVTCHA